VEKKTSTRKALGTRHKDVAQKMLKELSELELLGKIDPFAPGFDPKEALKGDQPVDKHYCATVKEALDKFYSAKQHLHEREKPLQVYLRDHHWDQLDEDFAQNMLEIMKSRRKIMGVISIPPKSDWQ